MSTTRRKLRPSKRVRVLIGWLAGYVLTVLLMAPFWSWGDGGGRWAPLLFFSLLLWPFGTMAGWLLIGIGRNLIGWIEGDPEGAATSTVLAETIVALAAWGFYVFALIDGTGNYY